MGKDVQLPTKEGKANIDGNPLYFAQATSDGIPRTDGSGDEFNLNTRDDQGIENNINDSDTGYFPGILKTFGIDITSFFNKKEKIDLSDARKMELLKQIRRDKNQTSYLDKTRESEFKEIINGISDNGDQTLNINIEKPMFGINKYYLEDKSIKGDKRFLFAREGGNFINSASQSNPGWHKYTNEATAETLARTLKSWEKKSPATLFLLNDMSWRTFEEGGRQGLNHHGNGTEIDMKFLTKNPPSLPSDSQRKYNSPNSNYDPQMTIEFINDMQKSLPKGYKLYVKFGDETLKKTLSKNKFIDFSYDNSGAHDDHLHFQVMKIPDTERIIREIKE